MKATRKSISLFLIAGLALWQWNCMKPMFGPAPQSGKAIKKAVKDGPALKRMNSLALISVWGVDWLVRGAAGPGHIGFAANVESHRTWMPDILAQFEPRLETQLQSLFKKTKQSFKPLSYTRGNSGYQAFTPSQEGPGLGKGRYLASMKGFQFIDADADDIATASKDLDVDGVITVRYEIAPSLVPMQKNKLKVWMKIFTKDGNLVWYSEGTGEFPGGPPKMRKYNSMIKLLEKGEKGALSSLEAIYVKSFKKIR